MADSRLLREAACALFVAIIVQTSHWSDALGGVGCERAHDVVAERVVLTVSFHKQFPVIPTAELDPTKYSSCNTLMLTNIAMSRPPAV